MDYLTYKFYTDIWGGSLPETLFTRYAARAWYALDCMTHGRIGKIWGQLSNGEKDAIRIALCALVDNLHANDQTQGREISLEIVGQHHVSYFQMTTSRQNQLRELVKPYLCGITYQGRALTYRGLDRRCGSC